MWWLEAPQADGGRQGPFGRPLVVPTGPDSGAPQAHADTGSSTPASSRRTTPGRLGACATGSRTTSGARWRHYQPSTTTSQRSEGPVLHRAEAHNRRRPTPRPATASGQARNSWGRSQRATQAGSSSALTEYPCRSRFPDIDRPGSQANRLRGSFSRRTTGCGRYGPTPP